MREGVDPTSSIATGRAALKEALQLESSYANAYIEAARLELVAAAWAVHTGRGPTKLLVNARTYAEKAIELDGNLADAKLAAAEVCLQAARAQPSHAIVDDGITYVNQALTRNPQLAKAQTVLAALLRLRAP